MSGFFFFFFFFNDTATTEIYTLSLHDASSDLGGRGGRRARHPVRHRQVPDVLCAPGAEARTRGTGACAMTGPACRDIRQALGVYVVGAIDPAERAAVDSHLSSCLDCREELAGLAGLPALLGRVPASEA